MKTLRRYGIFICAALAAAMAGPAAQAETPCQAADTACVLGLIGSAATTIDNPAWRDQIHRELAKSYAEAGNLDAATALIDGIENPDTRAMTIRGIGMGAAKLKLPDATYKSLFETLATKAAAIEHAPSRAIAFTYIAMAQAFAGRDAEARATAAGMENEALRHKAYGETAEIQAERGDAAAAMKSIGFISSDSYKNKAYATVSRILADHKFYDDALRAAQASGNSYLRAQSLQYLLDKQKNPTPDAPTP